MKIKLRRNRHNLSHYVLGSCNPGELIPVACVPVCPGDTIKHAISGVTRFLPMNAPIMHRINARYYSFFVSQRLVMDAEVWQDFITRSGDPDTIPTMTLGNIKADADCARLADYLGCQTATVTAGSTTTVSSIPFRIYNAIYNEWFRDKDLVSAVPTNSNTASDYQVLRGAWKKDPYTAARPWPQLGSDVTFPIEGTASVDVTDWSQSGQHTSEGHIQLGEASHASQATRFVAENTPAGNTIIDVDLIGTADLDAASGSVRAFRRALNLQAMAERLGQFGHDLPSMYASMGVKSSDARLQRPEYLGGGKVPVSVSEVLNTGDATGEMKGHAIAPASIRPYRRFFEEYGYIMTIMIVSPDPVYSTVIPRHFFHGLVDGPNDFYTPELERIGQQEIYKKEIYATNPAGGDTTTVWGYNNRYDELRREGSRVCGLFRVGQSLDEWTWARGFASAPSLNQTFIECNPATRVFQEETGQNVIFAVNNHMVAYRLLSKSVVGRTI